MVSSSSTKRAARLAQKGKGKRVRFQGGTLFPLIVMAVLVIGLGTIVYARQTQPETSPPTTNDHWHAAYGFSFCDQPEFTQLVGAKEETDANGNLISTAFLRTGVHSHEDGVIHWHPYTSAAVGNRARLGVFFDVYDIEVTDEAIRFPAEQGGQEYVEGETTCDGQPGEIRVVVWDNFGDAGAGTTYVSNFDDIRIDRDGMVFSIAFQPKDADVSKPPWAPNLPELGAVDTGSPIPTTSPQGSVPPSETVAPGGTVGPAGTVVPGGTIEPVTDGTTATTAAPASATTTPSTG